MFKSLGRVGLVEILDAPDAIPRVLRLRTSDVRVSELGVSDIVADLSPVEVARLERQCRPMNGIEGWATIANLSGLREDVRRILLRLQTPQEARALANFLGAWVRFEK